MTASQLGAVDGGRAPSGWEQLWLLDRWPLRALPHSDLHSSSSTGAIVFSGLVQPWLREAAKRWVRARLLTGTAPNSLRHYVDHLQAFSGWLAERTSEVNSPAQITRPVLEDYLLAVRASGLAAGTKPGRVGVLRAFLDEQREDGLAGLPRTAVIHPGELPTVGRWLPRGIEPGVFEQFIDPSNLALLFSEPQRTLILLLAFTGLRVSSIVTLPRDALQLGSDSHPYLRYVNVKLRREAVIPIGPELCEQLRRQERYLDETYGAEGTRFLLPSRRRRDGSQVSGQDHLDVSTVRQTVKRYVRKAGIRDSRGQLASWVHPHRFRHYLGSSMVNEGVPLPVIQRVLDHASIAMTDLTWTYANLAAGPRSPHARRQARLRVAAGARRLRLAVGRATRPARSRSAPPAVKRPALPHVRPRQGRARARSSGPRSDPAGTRGVDGSPSARARRRAARPAAAVRTARPPHP